MPSEGTDIAKLAFSVDTNGAQATIKTFIDHDLTAVAKAADTGALRLAHDLEPNGRLGRKIVAALQNSTDAINEIAAGKGLSKFFGKNNELEGRIGDLTRQVNDYASAFGSLKRLVSGNVDLILNEFGRMSEGAKFNIDLMSKSIARAFSSKAINKDSLAELLNSQFQSALDASQKVGQAQEAVNQKFNALLHERTNGGAIGAYNGLAQALANLKSVVASMPQNNAFERVEHLVAKQNVESLDEYSVAMQKYLGTLKATNKAYSADGFYAELDKNGATTKDAAETLSKFADAAGKLKEALNTNFDKGYSGSSGIASFIRKVSKNLGSNPLPDMTKFATGVDTFTSAVNDIKVLNITTLQQFLSGKSGSGNDWSASLGDKANNVREMGKALGLLAKHSGTINVDVEIGKISFANGGIPSQDDINTVVGNIKNAIGTIELPITPKIETKEINGKQVSEFDEMLQDIEGKLAASYARYGLMLNIDQPRQMIQDLRDIIDKLGDDLDKNPLKLNIIAPSQQQITGAATTAAQNISTAATGAQTLLNQTISTAAQSISSTASVSTQSINSAIGQATQSLTSTAASASTSVSQAVSAAQNKLVNNKTTVGPVKLTFVAHKQAVKDALGKIKPYLKSYDLKPPVKLQFAADTKDVAAVFAPITQYVQKLTLPKIDFPTPSQEDSNKLGTFAAKLKEIKDNFLEISGTLDGISKNLGKLGKFGIHNAAQMRLGQSSALTGKGLKDASKFMKEQDHIFSDLYEKALPERAEIQKEAIDTIAKDAKTQTKNYGELADAMKHVQEVIEENAKKGKQHAQESLAKAQKERTEKELGLKIEKDRARIAKKYLSARSDLIDDFDKRINKIDEAMGKGEQKPAPFNAKAWFGEGGSLYGRNAIGLNTTYLKELQLQAKLTGNAFADMLGTMGIALTGRNVISFFQSSIQSATTFGVELRRIQSLALDFSFEKLDSGLRNIDARLGNITHNAKALYWAFSSGVRGSEEQLVSFTEKMSKLAKVINSDVMPTMDAATAIMNAYGLSAEDAGKISDTLFSIVKYGKASGSQLAQSIGHVVAPAAALGVELDDLGATVATLTRSMRTQNALTYLNNILMKMQNPTGEVKETLDKLGLEINSTAIKAKGFARVIQEIRDATKGDINVITKLFPDIRGQRAAITLLSTQFEDFERQVQNFKNSEGNTDEAAAKLLNNPEAAFQALGNSLEMIRTEAGRAAINFLTMGGAVGGFIDKFNSMTSGKRTFLGYTVMIGGMLIGLSSLDKAIATLNYTLANFKVKKFGDEIKQMGLEAEAALSWKEQEQLRKEQMVAEAQERLDKEIAEDETLKNIKQQEEALRLREENVKQLRVQLKLTATRAQEAAKMLVLQEKINTATAKYDAASVTKDYADKQNDRRGYHEMQASIVQTQRAVLRDYNEVTNAMTKELGLVTKLGDDFKASLGNFIKRLGGTFEAYMKNGGQDIDPKRMQALASQVNLDYANSQQMTILRRVVLASIQRQSIDSLETMLAGKKNVARNEPTRLMAEVLKRNRDMQQSTEQLMNAIFGKEFTRAEIMNMRTVLTEEAAVLEERNQLEQKALEANERLNVKRKQDEINEQKAEAASARARNKQLATQYANMIKNAEAEGIDAYSKDPTGTSLKPIKERYHDMFAELTKKIGPVKPNENPVLALFNKALEQFKSGNYAKDAIDEMARQIRKQDFNGAQSAYAGIWAAANASGKSAENLMGLQRVMSKVTTLPGMGGMAANMLLRPISMFSNEFGKALSVLTIGMTKTVQKSIDWWGDSFKRQLARGVTADKITRSGVFTQFSANMLTGSLLNTDISTAGIKKTAESLKLTETQVVSALTGMSVAGLGVVGILALITAALSSMGENGGPLGKLAEKLTDLNKQTAKGSALGNINALVKDIARYKRDVRERLQLQYNEISATIKAQSELGATNAKTEQLTMRLNELGEALGKLDTVAGSSINDIRLRNRQRGINSYGIAQDALSSLFIGGKAISMGETLKKLGILIASMTGPGIIAALYTNIRDAFKGQTLTSWDLAKDVFSGIVGNIRKVAGDYEKELRDAAIVYGENLAKAFAVPVEVMQRLAMEELTSKQEGIDEDVFKKDASNSKKLMIVQRKITQYRRNLLDMQGGELSLLSRAAKLAKAENEARNELNKARIAAEMYLTAEDASADDKQYKDLKEREQRAQKNFDDAQKDLQKFQQSSENYYRLMQQNVKEEMDLRRKIQKDMEDARQSMYKAQSLFFASPDWLKPLVDGAGINSINAELNAMSEATKNAFEKYNNYEKEYREEQRKVAEGQLKLQNDQLENLKKRHEKDAKTLSDPDANFYEENIEALQKTIEHTRQRLRDRLRPRLKEVEGYYENIWPDKPRMLKEAKDAVDNAKKTIEDSEKRIIELRAKIEKRNAAREGESTYAKQLEIVEKARQAVIDAEMMQAPPDELKRRHDDYIQKAQAQAQKIAELRKAYSSIMQNMGDLIESLNDKRIDRIMSGKQGAPNGMTARQYGQKELSKLRKRLIGGQGEIMSEYQNFMDAQNKGDIANQILAMNRLGQARERYFKDLDREDHLVELLHQNEVDAIKGVIDMAAALNKLKTAAQEAVDATSAQAISLMFRTWEKPYQLPDVRMDNAVAQQQERSDRQRQWAAELQGSIGPTIEESMKAWIGKQDEEVKRFLTDNNKTINDSAHTFNTASKTFSDAVDRWGKNSGGGGVTIQAVNPYAK